MKATEQCFPVVLLIMLYKVILSFESVDEILKCDHSNESYWAVLSCGTVYYAVQGGSNFLSLWIKSSSMTIQMKATERYFPVVLFMLHKVVRTFESVDEILKCEVMGQYFHVVLTGPVVLSFCRQWILNPLLWSRLLKQQISFPSILRSFDILTTISKYKFIVVFRL